MSVCTADTSCTSAILVNLSRRSNNFSAIDYNLAVIVAAADACAAVGASRRAGGGDHAALNSDSPHIAFPRIVFIAGMGAACTDTGRQTGVTQFATTTAATNRSQLACVAIDNYLRLFLNPQASIGNAGIGVVLVNPAGLERVFAFIRQHQRHFAAFNGKRAGNARRHTRHIDIHAVQRDRVIAAGDGDSVRGCSGAIRLLDGVITIIRVLTHIAALFILRVAARRDDNGAISQIKLLTRRSLTGSSLLAALRFEFCGILSFLRAAAARFPCPNCRWQHAQHHDKCH